MKCSQCTEQNRSGCCRDPKTCIFKPELEEKDVKKDDN